MDTIELDKSFAVFGDANVGYDSNYNSEITDNLIHESGRLQLNTYQSFIANLMNPQSDINSLLLMHMTGTGKTITALATATEYVKQYRPQNENNPIASIVVLGFTKNIFRDELLAHPEFTFVNMDEAGELKNIELHMHESKNLEEKYYQKKKLYHRRLVKREVKGIYQFYGYKQFANKIINMDDLDKMHKKLTSEDLNDIARIDPDLLIKWINSGEVRINEPFIKTLSKSFIICDEVHNLYKMDQFNTYGVAINYVLNYFTNNPDPLYKGTIRSLLLSATPLTASALEIIPIISLLTSNIINKSDLFTLVDGVEQLTANGLSKIRQCISGHVSYIMDDNPKEYPSASFSGVSIKGIEYIKFIRTTPIDFQLECLNHWDERTNELDDRGSSIIKDIILPASEDSPYGTIYSKNISALANLPSNESIKKLNDGTYTSNIFKLNKLYKYSCKYAKMLQMCLDMKSKEHGKIFIFHPYVQGSGINMIISILIANGFILHGDVPAKNSICMYCDKTYGEHSKQDHDFTPVCMTFINGSLNKQVVNNRLEAFNNKMNLYGEKIKIIIGSKAMRESHTLKACRHIIITHEPSSISEMVQIVGRAVRKHVHADLPVNMRTVSINIISTNVSDIGLLDPAVNEEESYKAKILQYMQINKIERLIYDVSIDYLINFRFKLRESPLLFGDINDLDMNRYSKYEKILNTTYANLRNGNTKFAIHTNRFNLFYIDGEARIVMMIIKRVLLDFQPILTMADLRDIIRNPPFSIEYNTKLISDESIAIAIHRIVFSDSQLKIFRNDMDEQLQDSIFDQTSIVINHSGDECRVVCIGDPLCSDSYFILKTTISLVDGDKSIIDSCKQKYSYVTNDSIDTKELATVIDSAMDIDDIINDMKYYLSANQDLSAIVSKFSNKTHTMLVEWAIQQACDYAIYNTTVKDLEFLKNVIEFYVSTKLMLRIKDLENTKIYDRFKKYNTITPNGWWSKTTKPSLSMLPIGHMIEESVNIYQISDKTWLSLGSISMISANAKHPFGWYIYDEQIKDTISVATKIKFDEDKKTRGITMDFIPKTTLERIIKSLKLKMSSNESKKDIIARIIQECNERQKKIYPNMVIYRLVDM